MNVKNQFLIVTGLIMLFQYASLTACVWSFVNYSGSDKFFDVLTAFVFLGFSVLTYGLGMVFRKEYGIKVAEAMEKDLYKNMTRTQKRAFDRSTQKRKEAAGNFSPAKK